MTEYQLVCPKCNQPMVQGFMQDRGDHNIPQVGEWVEGHPRKGFLGFIKVPKKKRIPIGAFRCSSCGYLEFYAMDFFAATKKIT